MINDTVVCNLAQDPPKGTEHYLKEISALLQHQHCSKREHSLSFFFRRRDGFKEYMLWLVIVVYILGKEVFRSPTISDMKKIQKTDMFP